MRYLLAIYSSESAWTEDERAKCMAESSGVCLELAAKGQYLVAAPLYPVATARSVRVREGKTIITDGPFAETHEQLGGFYLIDVADLDEAIAIASRLPPAKKGTVEVRPVREVAGLPPERLPFEEDTEGCGDRYLLLCYDDQPFAPPSSSVVQKVLAEAVELTHRLGVEGKYLSAAPLHPTATATSVRVHAGKRLLTDGPFAETNEVLGGYYFIMAANPDEALAIAAQHPGARWGVVEVRRILELPPIPVPDACEIFNWRDLPFARPDVFRAFSDPARLARWWGPQGFRNTFHEFRFEPGGAWRFVMHGPDGKDYDNQCVFADIECPGRIVIDHVSAPAFRLTITLEALPGQRTRLVWRQRFPTAAIRDQIAKFAIKANQENLDRLTAELGSTS